MVVSGVSTAKSFSQKTLVILSYIVCYMLCVLIPLFKTINLQLWCLIWETTLTNNDFIQILLSGILLGTKHIVFSKQ